MFNIRERLGTPISVRMGVAAVAAVLLLGGCSGSRGPEAEAAEKGPATSSPIGNASSGETGTPMVIPTATPTMPVYKPATAEGPAENVPLPVMPELAKQESKEGLQAFAEYFYSLINYGFETGDRVPLENISGPGCLVCSNVYTMLSSGFEGEDWMVGGSMTVLNTKSSYETTSTGQYQILVQVKQDDYEYRGPNKVLYGKHEGVSSSTVQMIEATFQRGSWFAHNVVTIN